MTNNENKIDKEKAIDLIAGRINDEYRKHGSNVVDWQQIAAIKIHNQWFEYYQETILELEDEVAINKTTISRIEEDNRQTALAVEEKQAEIDFKKEAISALVEQKADLQQEIEELKKERDEAKRDLDFFKNHYRA